MVGVAYDRHVVEARATLPKSAGEGRFGKEARRLPSTGTRQLAMANERRDCSGRGTAGVLCSRQSSPGASYGVAHPLPRWRARSYRCPLPCRCGFVTAYAMHSSLSAFVLSILLGYFYTYELSPSSCPFYKSFSPT